MINLMPLLWIYENVNKKTIKKIKRKDLMKISRDAKY